MEFTCGAYDVRLTLNPTDMVLRLEHRDTKRLYERTFYDRDFAEVIVLGGLEFVGKVVAATIATATLKETTSEVTFALAFTHELLPKPLTLQFQVPAVKREKASADIEGLLARLKKMETALTLCKELSARVQDLEERCGDTITLPGCDYAIPVDVENLILIIDGGKLKDGHVFSSFYPSRFYDVGLHPESYLLIRDPSCVPGCNNKCQPSIWQEIPSHQKAFTFKALTNINNLKYCKKLKELTICGADSLENYNLSDLTNLTTLNIVGNTFHQTNGGKKYTPLLTDISWISNLKNLQKVSFQGCTILVTISALKDLPNLTEVDLRDTAVKNTGFLASSKLTIII
jgi:hypothetical protein